MEELAKGVSDAECRREGSAAQPRPCYDPPMRTGAEILVIGNEILTGKVQDVNGPFLIAGLREIGVELHRLTVLPDDLDLLASEIRRASSDVEHVFTTGGVGPTLDDVTIAAAARAFGVPLVRNPDLEHIIRTRATPPITDALLRMADLPDGAMLVQGDVSIWPVVAMRNVHIFPGTPSLVRRKFAMIRERFRQAPFILRRVDLVADEGHFSKTLDEVAARFPTVAFGSYPVDGADGYTAYVTFESKDASAVDAAVAAFVGGIPTKTVVAVR